ncbi:MAG TPA: AgmX/PglI C-terminal domain-containing protein [bacterium]|nr:AgmX/PglI C-terminal domain-containing protein [bacterium]
MNRIPNIKIGLLRSGRLINEVVVDDLNEVYVGTSLDNTIVIDSDGFYDKFPLFQFVDDKYVVNISALMDGKIFQQDNIISLSEIKKNNEIVTKDNIVSIPIAEEARGILFLEDKTILFKVYPSERTMKTLPREFRAGIITSDFDISFFSILSFLLIAYLFTVYSFSNVKYQNNNEINFEKIPERFARLIMDKPEPFKKKEPIIKEQTAKTKMISRNDLKRSDNKSVRGIKEKNVRNKDVTIASKGKSGGGSEVKRSSSEIVRSAGIIGIIGSKGKGGTVANLFQESGFNDKLDKALKGVSGLRAGSTIQEAKIRRGSGDAKGVDIGSLKTTTGSGLVAFGEGQDTGTVNILGNIQEGDVGGSGSMSPAIIAKTLSQHVSAFQYCYNKALKSNPRLSGELKVMFMILLSGNVSADNMSFSGTAAKDKELTSCVQRVFTRIKFPGPKGGEVIVNYPLNFTAQN